MPAGSYAVSMRKAGDPESTKPVLTTDVTVAVGNAYTVAGVGKFADLELKVIDDDISAPPAGQAKVRVVQASVRAPILDVAAASGPTIATGVQFATTTDYREVKPGDWQVELQPTGGDATTVDCALESGTTYSLLVLDAKDGGLTTDLKIDATARRGDPRGWGGHRRRRHERQRHAVRPVRERGRGAARRARGSRRDRSAAAGAQQLVSEEDRPSPGTAIARHRWGWPVPARKAVTVGLAVIAFASIVVAGTTLAARDHRQAATGRAALARRDRRRDPRGAAGRAGPAREAADPGAGAQLGVDSSLVGLRLGPDGALEAPKDYQQAGWYAHGTVPGDIGPAVIAGHVDSLRRPRGVLPPRRPARRATASRCSATACRLPFRWSPPRRYPKDKFPTAAGLRPHADAPSCG